MKVPENFLSSVSDSNYIEKGSIGDDVLELQKALIALDYSCGSWGADGDFGRDTFNAVVKFQRDNNLEIDGQVGPETVRKLIELLQKVEEKPAAQTPASSTPASSSQPTTSQPSSSTSGFCAATVIKIAQEEVGYREKASNSNLDSKTSNAGGGNWTKYARDLAAAGYYSLNGYAWCDMFVDWCFYMAAGKDATRARKAQCTQGSGSAACATSAQHFKDAGQWSNTPVVGAQIFFYSGGGINHTGIVTSFNNSTVYTVEGNSADMVAVRSYSRNSSYIAGYGIPIFDNAPTSNSGTSVVEHQPAVLTRTTFPCTVVIDTDVLNVRKEPHPEAEVVSTVSRNQQVVITDDQEGWGKLQSGAGWINLLYAYVKNV